MKVKKVGRPRKFEEPTHKFLLVLPESLFEELRKVNKSPEGTNGFKAKKSVTELILAAIKVYIK